MQRITVILILFILLMNGRHGSDRPPASFDSLVVQARPIAIPANARSNDYGALRLLGAWQLTSPNQAFGGISSLSATPDGRLTGLNDTGELFAFRVGGPQGTGLVQPLPVQSSERNWPRWKWDSESMAVDAATRKAWVGFELVQRICRYDLAFARAERCVEPAAMQDWPLTGSIESLVRLSGNRFMAISEMGRGTHGANDVLLWQGDPTEATTPAPSHLRYEPPTGYLPTDALWLGGDRLLVLNRRLTLAEGFTAKLVLVRLPALRAGAILRDRKSVV